MLIHKNGIDMASTNLFGLWGIKPMSYHRWQWDDAWYRGLRRRNRRKKRLRRHM